MLEAAQNLTVTTVCPQVAVQNNELMFPSNKRSASHKNMDRYSYHVYGGAGYFYGVLYLSVKNQVRASLVLHAACKASPPSTTVLNGAAHLRSSCGLASISQVLARQ